jgi:hypothetical protein
MRIGGASLSGIYSDRLRQSIGGKTRVSMLQSETVMPHAIIRGKNGRRHEVDFGDAPVRVEIHSSEETVEIFIEADFESLPEERRRDTQYPSPSI